MTFFPIQKYRRHITCQHTLQISHYEVFNSPGIVFVMSETIINLSFTFQWCSSPMTEKPASKADAGGFSWSRAPFSSSLDFVDSCSALLNCFRIVQQCEMMAPTFLPSFRKSGCLHNPWIHPGFTCFLCFFGPKGSPQETTSLSNSTSCPASQRICTNKEKHVPIFNDVNKYKILNPLVGCRVNFLKDLHRIAETMQRGFYRANF